MTRFTPQWLQAGQYAASVDRRLIGALWPAPAVGGCAVTVASGMTVNIAAGTVAVPAANGTGSVLCTSDAVEPVTLAAAPGAGTNRYDLVICQARGNDLDGGANNDWLYTTVTGTAAASPTVPAVPNNAVAVAQIYVPGGSASVTAGNIADRRPLSEMIPPALARVTVTQGGITTTTTDLTGMTVTFWAPGTRRYRLTMQIALQSTVLNDLAFIYLTDGANNNIATGQYNMFASNTACTLIASDVPAAGFITYKLRLQRTSGTGTLSLVASAPTPAILLVEDIGPAT